MFAMLFLNWFFNLGGKLMNLVQSNISLWPLGCLSWLPSTSWSFTFSVAVHQCEPLSKCLICGGPMLIIIIVVLMVDVKLLVILLQLLGHVLSAHPQCWLSHMPKHWRDRGSCLVNHCLGAVQDTPSPPPPPLSPLSPPQSSLKA